VIQKIEMVYKYQILIELFKKYYSYVSWLMELSQYSEGITVTFQNFVQYYQSDQFCNTFISWLMTLA